MRKSGVGGGGRLPGVCELTNDRSRVKWRRNVPRHRTIEHILPQNAPELFIWLKGTWAKCVFLTSKWHDSHWKIARKRQQNGDKERKKREKTHHTPTRIEIDLNVKRHFLCSGKKGSKQYVQENWLPLLLSTKQTYIKIEMRQSR